MSNPLQQCLQEKGWSLYRLSQESGLPYATLHGYAHSTAKLAACSAATLHALALTLGVPMETFFAADDLYLPPRFAACFWDCDWKGLTAKNIPFVIARLYDRGGIPGLLFVEKNFTLEQRVAAIKSQRDFTPVCANFLAQRYALDKSEMAYYRFPKTSRRDF